MRETDLKTAGAPVVDRGAFLSTLPATRADRIAASAIVGVSAILFAIAVPLASVPLTPVPAFVASYQSALAIIDMVKGVDRSAYIRRCGIVAKSGGRSGDWSRTLPEA